MKRLVKSFYVKNERGVVAIIIALSMVVFISLAALSIDIGYALVTRNQLQNVADSAALAAAGELGNIYTGMSYSDQQLGVTSAQQSLIVTTAQQTALMNQAGGKYIGINDSDVIIGKWNSVSKSVEPLTPQNAVKVTARRDASANGPITTFFAGIFGTKTANLTASATAALTGQSSTLARALYLPAAISINNPCNQNIQFYPANSAAGWNTFTDPSHSAHTLKTILEQLTNGTYQSPPTTAGVTQFNFTGGADTSVISPMKTLFDTMKNLPDGKLNGVVVDYDTNPNTWTTEVPVYQPTDQQNPTGWLPIVDYALVVIKDVIGPPTNTIDAQVICDFVGAGRGGGNTAYGTIGSIPSLVQ